MNVKNTFSAEKDIWKVATQIIKERKKRELDPMFKLLSPLENVDGDKKRPRHQTVFGYSYRHPQIWRPADKMLDVMVKADESWF